MTTAVGRRGTGDIVLEKLRGVGIAKGHTLSEKLVSAFDEAYLNAKLFDDAASMKWSKMLTNLIANPTSAILDMTPAEIFANRDLYELEIDLLKECLAVMEVQGIDVVDLETGRQYEILAGTDSNLARHGRRMSGEFFRMLTF